MTSDENPASGPDVWVRPHVQAGGCNTCTRRNAHVYVIQGRGLTTEIRMCEQCAREFVARRRDLQGHRRLR